MEPEDEVEREFLTIIRDGRRKVFEGPGAMVPEADRQAVLAGMQIKDDKTGALIATLADDDAVILARFRAINRG